MSGAPFERGRQLGEAAASRIARSVEIYRDVFAHYAGWNWLRVRERASSYLAPIEAYQARYLEEMKGMARGAGMDVLDVVALNVRTEIMFSAVAKGVKGECTAFVALPEVTDDGHTLMGQNWDWKTPTSETIILLEAEQDAGPSYVTAVEAGILAKTGFNSAGIGLVTNALVTDLDHGDPGVPYHVILRAILDAQTIDEATRAITRSARASAANYLIASRQGESVNVEAIPGGPEGTYLSGPKSGICVHTNHFIAPDFGQKDVSLEQWPDSPIRARRMTSQLERHLGRLRPEVIRTTLKDHFNFPNAICAHPDPQDPEPERGATIASIIMDLSTSSMWLAQGNPCAAPFTRVDYRSFFEA